MMTAMACSQSTTPDVMLTPESDLGVREQTSDASFGPDTSSLPADASMSPDAATPEDMSGGAGEDMSSPAPPDMSSGDPSAKLDAPATTELVTHSFAMDIQGSGTAIVGSASVSQNVVSVEIDGVTFGGVIQERQAWPDFSLVLYQSLLVSADDVRVAWFYCDGGRLAWIYHEGSRSPMRDEAMQGTCEATSMASTTSEVQLPAVSFDPPEPLQGYRVDGGDAIQIYDGSDASMQSFAVFGGERFRLYPFEQVDCSKECGSPGWYEIHTLIERERDDALGFIIFYLRNSGQIEGHYSIVWPGFEVITPQTLSATWTTP